MARTALFEVGFAGGASLHAWQAASEDFAAWDWASLVAEEYPAHVRLAARLSWTEAAFNEHCTAAAMAQMLDALIVAGAPLDLLGVVSTFPLEELVHVELCGRLAMRLGGGAPIAYDPEDLRLDFAPGLTPLQRANELVLRVCCVGEAFSLPMLAGARRVATHPLVQRVLTRIVHDEAPHGLFGWRWFDWAAPSLGADERDRLHDVAIDAIGHVRDRWRGQSAASHVEDAAAHAALGAMDRTQWLAEAERAITDVEVALAARGLLREG